VVAPAGTPEPILARLENEIAQAVRQPSMQRLAETRLRLVGNTRAEFASLVVAERERWGTAIRRDGIALE